MPRRRRSRPTRRRDKQGPRDRRRLRCEALEDRRMLAVLTVTNGADEGPGSLRDAIEQANGLEGPDEIVFDGAYFSTPRVVPLESQLPTVVDDLTITGPGRDLLTIDAQHGADGEADTGDGWRILEVFDGSLSIDIQVGLSGLTFANADFNGDGGAIFNREGLHIDSVAFTDNHASGEGGAVYDHGVLEVTLSRFIDNAAGHGGAIYTRGANVATTLFEANSAYRGGAIYAAGPAELVDSAIVNNTATHGAGAWITGRVAIEGVTISGNRADEGAALVFNGTGFGGSTVAHSTIVRNINLRTSSSLGAAYSAAIGLDPPFIGGEANRVRFTNSIVAETIDGDGSPASDVTAGPFSFTHSLLGTGNTAFDGVDGNRIGGVGEDRLLAELEPLGYYGGPTPTHPLQADSPALDAGDPAIAAGGYDQRGAPYARLADGGGGLRVDMGAYESQGPPLETRLGDFNGDGFFDAADYTVWRDALGATVPPLTSADADGNGVVDTIDFDIWRQRFGEKYLTGLVVNDLGDADDGDIFNGVTTLREAINYANVNPEFNEIEFDRSLSGGVIEVGSTGGYYQIEDELTIDARMLPEGITLDAGGRTTGLHINAFFVSEDNEFDVTLAGLTIRNGVGRVRGGGAVDSMMFGTLTIIDSELIDNVSGGGPGAGLGGAIHALGPVVLIDSVIDGAIGRGRQTGTGAGGGAIFAAGDVTLVRTEIRNVVAERSGGAIAASNYGRGNFSELMRAEQAPSVMLVDSSITNATGGGIHATGDVRLDNSVVSGGTDFGVLTYLEPVYDSTGNVSLVDSVVRGFTSEDGNHYVGGYDFDRGGAGVIAYGDVSLVSSRVEDNAVVQPGSDAHGGGIAAVGTVTLLDSHVVGNAASFGGGIYAEGFDAELAFDSFLPTVSVTGGSVSHNLAFANGAPTGGAIQSAGSIQIDSAYLAGNYATTSYDWDLRGGHVIYGGYSFRDSVTLTIANSTIESNGPEGLPNEIDGLSPPAVYLAGGSLSVTGTKVSGNKSDGIFVYAGSAFVSGSEVDRNTGVGIEASSDVELIDSVVRGNLSHIATADLFNVYGGAGVRGGTVVLIRTTVEDNALFAEGLSNPIRIGGGGVYANSWFTAIDSTIRDNATYGDGVHGGGVFVDHGSVRLINSTLSGNFTSGADSYGGGLYATNGPVQLVQATVSGNRTHGDDSHGGGVYANLVEVSYSTIADNRASGPDSQGGGLYTTNLSSAGGLFANNHVGDSALSAGPDAYVAAIPILRYSLLSDSSGSRAAEGDNATNLLDVDPRIGPLARNGGLTETHSLLPGSPAIDAGTPRGGGPFGLVIDIVWRDTLPEFYEQRGAPYDRFADGGPGSDGHGDDGIGEDRIDMGAYEAQAPPTATPGDYNADGAVDAADYSLWRDAYGAAVAPLTGADGTGDGLVDEADHAAWAGHFGFTQPVALTAPIIDGALAVLPMAPTEPRVHEALPIPPQRFEANDIALLLLVDDNEAEAHESPDNPAAGDHSTKEEADDADAPLLTNL